MPIYVTRAHEHLRSEGYIRKCLMHVLKRFLGRRARDYQASVLRKRLRSTAESIRGEVMSRGWHERPVIGPALMWINRHVPW